MIENILAITGGMGTGKSTVLGLFEKNGFIVVNSDKEVVSLFDDSYFRYKEVAQDFDDWLGTYFADEKCIDKKVLRTYLETTPNGFPKSLEIVKPYITEKLQQLAEEFSGQKIVFEIPLLFEAAMEKNYKNILVVTTPLNIRIDRIKLRQPHLSLEQIQQTINSQLPENYKTEKANFIINNSGTIEDLEEKFNYMLPEFLKIYNSNKPKFKK